jgi:ribonuclease-3
MASLEKLERTISYQFRNRQFLELALSHRSLGKQNNERLEFLGDSILNCTISQCLYTQCPEASEGDLSRLRASLVKGETLAEIAREFDFGQYLRLGQGELKSGGFDRSSILADAVEAIIGAIYLDSGLLKAQEITELWFKSRLQQLDPHEVLKDPKTRLQEYLQAKRFALPEYSVVQVTGAAHNQRFTVSCEVQGLSKAIVGEASSRRKAEQKAARLALGELEKQVK